MAQAGQKDLWNRYVNSVSKYPPMNVFGWKSIIEDAYGLDTIFFIATSDGDKVRGVLPTYIVKDLKRRKRLFSLRFGFMADGDESQKELISYAKECSDKTKVAYSTITSGYDRAYTGHFQELKKKTLIINTDGPEEAIWKGLRDKTRNMIRKAKKSGLDIELGVKNLTGFYSIYVANMVRKGIPVHTLKFFECIFNELGSAAELIAAKDGNRIVGGTLILFSEKAAIYPFQASLPEYKKYAVNDIMVWEAIKLCSKKKVPTLDMGESTEGGNVYRFKQNFGGVPRDIHYYTDEPQKKDVYYDAGSKSRQKTSFTRKAVSDSPFWFGKKLGHWIKRRERII